MHELLEKDLCLSMNKGVVRAAFPPLGLEWARGSLNGIRGSSSGENEEAEWKNQLEGLTFQHTEAITGNLSERAEGSGFRQTQWEPQPVWCGLHLYP